MKQVWFWTNAIRVVDSPQRHEFAVKYAVRFNGLKIVKNEKLGWLSNRFFANIEDLIRRHV